MGVTGLYADPTLPAQDINQYNVAATSKQGVQVAKQRAESVHREFELGDKTIVVGRYTESVVSELRGHPDIAYVERDQSVSRPEPPKEEEPEEDEEAEPQFIFDDSYPGGLRQVNADAAHETGLTGDGIDIAIIDSGIDSTHSDLQDNLGEGYAAIECEGDCPVPWDDDNGHGTHCAGIAAAVQNYEGIVGVAPEATLHAVKVLGADGWGSSSSVAEGIRWVADQGYEVANLSLGSFGASALQRDAINYAHDEGVMLVAAAGNEGPCTDCVYHPAAFEDVIAVSATAGDFLSFFSSTGPEIDLAAPGSGIFSTYNGDIFTYMWLWGTSMAAPHVAGAAALLLENGYTPEQARIRLLQTATDLGLARSEQGFGRLNLAAYGIEPRIRTLPPSDVTATEATLRGELVSVGDMDEVSVSFGYGPPPESGEFWEETPQHTESQRLTEPVQFQTRVEELEPDTEYGVAAMGGSEPRLIPAVTDNLVTFTTEEEPAEALTVTTQSATEVGRDTATLQGQLTAIGTAERVTVGFQYRRRGAAEWTRTRLEAVAEPTVFTRQVSGLAAESEYEFRAVAQAAAVTTTPGTEFTPDATGQTQTFTTTEALPNHLVILGGSPSNIVEYSFTVTGDVEKSGRAGEAPIADEHVTIDPDDVIQESSVTGALGGGGDAYVFDGEITAGTVSGTVGDDVRIFLNDQELDAFPPGDDGDEPRTIRIEADGGGVVVYEIEASEGIREGAEAEDFIEGNFAYGHVGPKRGVDTFEFWGEVDGLQVVGPATVSIDGEEVEPASYPATTNAYTEADFPETSGTNELRIEAAGTGVAAYEFTVSGSVEQTDNPGEDQVSGQSAYGHLGPDRGTDIFEFTGTITEFDLAGPAGVYLNGQQVDPRGTSVNLEVADESSTTTTTDTTTTTTETPTTTTTTETPTTSTTTTTTTSTTTTTTTTEESDTTTTTTTEEEEEGEQETTGESLIDRFLRF